MARSLARGWREPILCTDSGSGRAARLVEEVGGEVVASNAELAERADVVMLCHKPAGLGKVAGELGDAASVVVSLLGATPLATLQEALPGATVFRAIPNLAVEVRRGVTCWCAADGADPGTTAQVRELFERVGRVEQLPETLMDVATGTVGVSPAYVSLIAEAQIDAAVKQGLPSGRADGARGRCHRGLGGAAARPRRRHAGTSARGHLPRRKHRTWPGRS